MQHLTTPPGGWGGVGKFASEQTAVSAQTHKCGQLTSAQRWLGAVHRRSASRVARHAQPSKAKGEDLRWLVVYKRVVEELPIDTIALECRVCATFVKDIVSLFHRTNGVESRQGVRDAPPANLVMTQEAAHEK